MKELEFELTFHGRNLDYLVPQEYRRAADPDRIAKTILNEYKIEGPTAKFHDMWKDNFDLVESIIKRYGKGNYDPKQVREEL